MVQTATALLTPERLSRLRAESHSLGAARAHRDYKSFSGQMRRASTLSLMNALRMATMRPPTPYSGQPRRRRSGCATGRKGGVATLTTAETALAEVVALAVAAVKLGETAILAGVATATTVAVGAAVGEAGEAPRVLVVAQDAANGETRVVTTGGVAAALEEALESGGILREVVQRGMVCPPPRRPLPARARTTAR